MIVPHKCGLANVKNGAVSVTFWAATTARNYEAFFLRHQVGLMLDTLLPLNVPIILDDDH